jgi:hypothetical protein
MAVRSKKGEKIFQQRKKFSDKKGGGNPKWASNPCPLL